MASPRDTDAVEISTEEQADEERQHTLSELCTDFFLLGLQIQVGQLELPPSETLRRRLLQAFESIRSKAGKAGLHPNDMEDVRYALAAYLDEMIHYSEWSGREDWAARPLQAIMFNDTKAGKHFFDRLSEVRRRSPAALEIYYSCLVLGFQGEYRLTGATQDLDELVEDLKREVTGGAVPKNISVHGKRPESLGMGGRRLPLVGMAVACLVLGVLGVAALYLILHVTQSSVLELLGQLGRG